MTAPTSSTLPIGRWIPVVVILLLGAACLAGMDYLYAGFRKTPTWEKIFADIAAKYPTVQQTTTSELADKLDSPDHLAFPMLIDCREPEEFQRSHLPAALNLTTVDEVRAIAAGREIIVYCSVGVRSSALAEALAKAGINNVSNLKGSIFQWANEGRELRAPDGTKTTDVHPFNSRWGALLK